MKVNATLNGRTVVLEVPDRELAALSIPEELNQRQAAAYCHVSPRTLRNWGVPKNVNGRYSVKLLQERMEGKGEFMMKRRKKKNKKRDIRTFEADPDVKIILKKRTSGGKTMGDLVNAAIRAYDTKGGV